MAIEPTDEQMKEFAARAPAGPLTMLNLLKFKPQAEYEDGRETDWTGEQAYMAYGAGVAKLVAEFGGRFVFGGQMNVQLIGEDPLAWDMLGVVEYPSLEAFQQMITSPAYAELAVHRTAGLAHQLLINCLNPGQTPGR